MAVDVEDRHERRVETERLKSLASAMRDKFAVVVEEPLPGRLVELLDELERRENNQDTTVANRSTSAHHKKPTKLA